MADKSATFNLNVTSNGTTEKETKAAKALNSELAKAAKAQTYVPKAVAAAKQGVAAGQIDNSGDSGKARGITGSTGAEGRDFAKQASGLGGLVHVYATFAANLFAISAGFQALSKAANVTNMVKGLDQLGAASGRNLGSIAKQLSMVTDGTVSLQEAMSATAQASSVGMSSTNILRMGEVAKKASQALGRDMTDALSRLSRGITKIEPELLDELGIMVKVDQATQNYARTLGKSASSLTDFEKRQAFANEVLSQAEQKFGNIKLDANPYQKILASIQNLTQSGLELVNKVLGPIMSALSQSPTALAGVLAGLGTILLKQAIPAISSFRENLSKAADQADAVKISIAKRRSTAYDEKDIDKVAALAAKEKAIMADLTKAKTEYLNVGKGKNLKATLSGLDATNSNLSEAVSKQAHSRELDINNTLRKKGIDLTGEALKQANLEKQAILNVTKASKDLLEVRKNLDAELAKADAPDSLTRKANQAVIDKANARAMKSRIVSNTAENFVSVGPVTALKELYKEVRNATKGLDAAGKPFIDGTKNMSGFAAATTFAKASISGFAASTMLMASALSSVGIIVGMAVAAFELLDSWLSTNSKEAEKTAQSLTTLHDAALMIDKVLANIREKGDPLAYISVESITAKATVMTELSSSFERVLKNVKTQDQTASGWDKYIIDATKSLVGGGLLKDSAREISLGLQEAMKLVPKGSATEKDIVKIIGVDPTDMKAVFKTLTADESGGAFYAIMDKLVPKLKEVALAAANVGSNAAKLEESFKVAGKTLDAILVAAIPTDSFAKFGGELIAIGRDMTQAFRDPETALSNLVSTTNDFTKLRMFDPAIAKALMVQGGEIKENVAQYVAFNSQLKIQEEELAKINKLKAENDKNAAYGQNAEGKSIRLGGANPYAAKASDLSANIASTKAFVEEAEKKAVKNIGLLTVAQNDVFVRGARLVETSINVGFEKAALTIAKAIASGVSTDTSGGSALQTDLIKKSADIELSQLNATLEVIKSQNKLRIATEKLVNAQDIQNLDNKMSRKEVTPELFSKLMSSLTAKREGLELEGKGRYNVGPKAVKLVQEDLASEDEAKQQAAQGALAAIQQAQAVNAKVSQIAAEKRAADIKQEIFDAGHAVALEKERNQVKLSSTNLDKSRLDYSIANSDYVSKEIVDKKRTLENTIADLGYKIELADITKKITEEEKAQAIARKEGRSSDAAKIGASITELKTRKGQTLDLQKVKEGERSIKVEEDDKAIAKRNFDFIQGLDKLRFDNLNQLSNTRIAQDEEGLARIKTLIDDPVAIVNAEAELALTKERQRTVENIATLQQASAKDTFDRMQKINSIQPGEDKSASEKALADSQALYSAKIAGEGKIFAAKQATIELQKTLNAEQAKQLEVMNKLVEVTDSLGTVFGNIGKAIGDTSQALLKMASTEETYNTKKIALAEEYNKTINNSNSDPKDRHIAEQALATQTAKLDKKNAKDQLTNLADVAGATKKMFAEKTFAYKAAAAIEKTIHVAKIAMMIQEMIVAGTTTPPVVAANTAKAGSNALTAITAAFSAPFPVGFVAGAAMIAIMASLLGGRGPKAPPAGFTAEEQQKVQGTGQRYENGKVVNTGLGILGDEKAKNESVVKGIELIERHSFDGLEFSNKMLDALKAIKDNTASFGKSLLNVGGIRIKADAIKGGNWLTGNTSSKIEDAGIKLSGTIEDITKGLGQLSTYTNTIESSSGLLGLFKSTDFTTATNPLKDSKLQGEIGAVFSSVRDALVEAGNKLGIDTVAAVVNGMDVTKAFDRVATLGLTGQEMIDAILSQVGLVMDQAALAAFPQLANLGQIGESFADTVIRVADDARIMSMSMTSIGKNITPLVETVATVPQTLLDAYQTAQNNLATAKLATEQTHTVTNTRNVGGDAEYIETYTSVVKGSEEATQGLISAEKALSDARDAITKVTGQNTTKNIEVTERLIKLAGGTDAFLSKVDFFKSNFLSEAEQLAPVQKAVSEEMARLGYSSITTRKQFKELVLSLDLSNKNAQETYTSLMNVASGFSTVYKDTAENTKLEQELLSALGLTYDALLLQRKEELSTLSDSERVMKERIYAVQDANKTEALQLELLDATGRFTETLTARRKQELRGLSSVDATLKTRIWLLQDEKKLLDSKTAQEVKIYGLLGMAEEALRLTRAQELAALDPQLTASQLYIYALEDEASLKDKLKSAYDKESLTLKDIISKTKDFIKTLKDYRDSLVLGDNSILTPAQKYAEAKRQFLQVSAIATNIAITDAQKQAQADAIGKLPAISDTFLMASKNLYASSESYNTDFATVLDILDKTSSYLDVQQSDAEKTLNALDKQTTIQQIIADNTKNSTELLKQFLEAQKNTEAAKLVAASAGSAAAGGSFTAPIGNAVNASAVIDSTGSGWIHGANGYTGTFAEGKQTIIDSLKDIEAGKITPSELVDAIVKQGITSTMLDNILGKAAGTSTAWALAHGITGFRNGGTPKGLAMVGEEGREFVDFQTPARVYNNKQTEGMFSSNQELVQELKLLREEVAQLRAEQQDQTNYMIKTNYDANNMVADRVAAAQTEASNSAEWKRRNQPKIA